MPSEITMPQQTDTMTEGTVVKWCKKEGDKIKPGEVVVEIETDKATMEIEAFDGGTLAHIAVAEGAKAPVGAVIAILATGHDDPAEIKRRATGAAAAPPPKPASIALTVPEPVAAVADAHPGATFTAASTSEVHEAANIGHGATREKPTAVPPLRTNRFDGNGRSFASPLARRIAADRRIDLSKIIGTGPGGRVVQEDVLTYLPAAEKPSSEKPVAEKPAAEKATPAAPPAPVLPVRVARGEKEVIPLTKMRAAIGKALQKSKQTVPHFYTAVDVDVEELSALRVRLNEMLKAENVKLSISDFVAKATAAALVKHPAVNAHISDEGITRFGDVNLGIAVAIPDGLIVPVLRGVDQMGLKEIRIKSDDLIKRARVQKLKQEEGRGATFTISNLGTFGVKEFSAIINPPEVAILAVAGAEKRAVVRDGAIVARTMMTLTLSADHRAVDGALAAEFLRTLKNLLEEPALMLA